MTDFNKIRYRPVTEFLTLENVQLQQIYKRMTVVYGENVPLYPMVTRWDAEFRRDRRSLQDEPRLVRPCEAVCEENCGATRLGGSPCRYPGLGWVGSKADVLPTRVGLQLPSTASRGFATLRAYAHG